MPKKFLPDFCNCMAKQIVMYQFKIRKQEDGGYKFELGSIKMFIDDYSIKDDKHILAHPDKAVAYFNLGGNVYGVSNEPRNFDTAEAFYDAMCTQYMMFIDGRVINDEQVGADCNTAKQPLIKAENNEMSKRV